jgi:E3 ubiquitin-protein ligase HUWE1
LRLLDVWRYPRGDLHSWIPALDRFDTLLAEVIESYEIHKLQTNDFTPKTKELVLEVLRMQRLLLEHCTNRKLFASYDVSHPSQEILLTPATERPPPHLGH